MALLKKAIVKIKGTQIELGGEQFVMPPLSLLHLEQFQSKFKSFDGVPTNPENISFFIDSVHAAMKRNYPECTREDIGEALGLESMNEVMSALVSVSGLTHRAKEDSEVGEAQAVN